MSNQNEKLHIPKPYLPLVVAWPPKPESLKELLALIKTKKDGAEAKETDY